MTRLALALAFLAAAVWWLLTLAPALDAAVMEWRN